MAMEVGEWYAHKHTFSSAYVDINEELYFLAAAEQKNGGMAGMRVTVDLSRPRAKPKFKKSSVSKFEAHTLVPTPGGFWRRINKSDLPAKVRAELG